MSSTLRQLRQILGEAAVRSDATSLSVYGVDRSTQWAAAPSAVVWPDSTEQVQAVVRLANQLGFALVPSGGRTGLSGGAVANAGEVVLSLERMNSIGAFDPIEQTVQVQAGVVTQRIQEFARAQGLYYPVDFAAVGSSQIGGNIATNAGGIKVIRYGMTRDWVRGLSVVTGAGEILQLNGGLLKNNTGYDFRHLMIGSEGTLGVICGATLGLARAPRDPLVLVLGVRDFAALMPVLMAFKAAMPLRAFECFSENGLARVVAAHALSRPFAHISPYYALIELDEGPEVVDAAVALFEASLARGEVEDGVVSQSLSEAQNLWKLREYLSDTLARWTPYKNDLAVAVSRLPAFIDEAERLVAARYPDFEVVWYGHIGDGNLHLNILKPDGMEATTFVSHCAAVSQELGALVQAHGGSISAEHGVGLLKKPYLHYSRSLAEIELMRGLKRVFDPRGVLNPGKIFANVTPP